MSLKFGIYLVEQRVVTPEQFCGLVKIQQESVTSGAKIALDRNMMTIKQVSNVIDAQLSNGGKSFHHTAKEMGYISSTEANLLIKAQEINSPSIRELSIDCGLLTPAQCRVLFAQFERAENAIVAGSNKRVADAKSTLPSPTATPAPAAPTPTPLRQPNFKRRPVIIHQKQGQI